MFTVIEECVFPASHQIVDAKGILEPLHAHDWLLRVHVQRKLLDQHKMVVDFLDLQAAMKEAIAPFEGQVINEVSIFRDGVNATAEMLAWEIYKTLSGRLDEEEVRISKVELREAPTSWAVIEPSVVEK